VVPTGVLGLPHATATDNSTSDRRTRRIRSTNAALVVRRAWALATDEVTGTFYARALANSRIVIAVRIDAALDVVRAATKACEVDAIVFVAPRRRLANSNESICGASLARFRKGGSEGEGQRQDSEGMLHLGYVVRIFW